MIEGVNLLEEALDAHAQVDAVYVDGAWAAKRSRGPMQSTGPGSGERLAGLLGRCHDEGTRVFELLPGVMERVAATVTPQPVMAVVRTPEHRLAGLQARAPALVVVCVDVRDPGNAGTVLRSAWAAGAGGVVCCGGTVDIWNPKAVRASAGAVLHVPVVYEASARDALEEMGRWGLRRLGTVAHGGQDYATVDLAGPVALVFGNEAGGLPVAELGGLLEGLLTIPMAAGAGSLYVGMAAAVLCFEGARQRRLAAG